MLKSSKPVTLVLAALLAVLLLPGCSEKQQQGKTAAPKEVELVYVEWTSAVASTNVVRAVLEQQGYKVTVTPVSAAAMWHGCPPRMRIISSR
jgi:glycine betaine/proline transport system substrate-binding protein